VDGSIPTIDGSSPTIDESSHRRSDTNGKNQIFLHLDAEYSRRASERRRLAGRREAVETRTRERARENAVVMRVAAAAARENAPECA
jgi:hypothetical protein